MADDIAAVLRGNRGNMAGKPIAPGRIGLMIGLVLLMLAVLVWFYPSVSDFKAENPSWNGARDFIDDFQVSPLDSFDALPGTSEETSLIIVPYVTFSSADLDRLEGYVGSGGRLVVLDDYGFGNQILEHLGLEVRFSGSQLLDPLFNHKNKNLPRMLNFAAVPATRGVESLVLNHATSLENAPVDRVVAWSSYFSFSDEDQDGEWGEGEARGPLPVIARFELSDGELLLVADPSILISGMLDMDDNRQFLQNIVLGQAFLDQSHLPDVPLDEAKAALRLSRGALATVWGMVGLILLVLALALRPIWYNRGGQDG